MADLFSGAQDYASLKRRTLDAVRPDRWARFWPASSDPGTSLERVPAGDANTPT